MNFEESGIRNIPVEKMNEAEKIYETNLLNYKKCKRASLEIIDNLSENLDTNRNIFMQSIGFEQEDDNLHKLKIKLNHEIKKK